MPSVAILGASADRKKFGNKSVRAHARAGWTVFPIHPKELVVEGHRAFASVLNVPIRPIDRISVYLPANITLPIIDELVDVHPGELWLNPGADDPEVVAMAKARGFNVVCGCSIIDVGYIPADFPDA